MKLMILLLIGTLVAGIAALFAGANDIVVTVDFLVTQVHWPLALVILVAFFAGLLVAAILWLPTYFGLRTKLTFLRKENQALQQEVKVLRTSPLKEPD
ncbi:MAG: LapA family protein [Gammaproteobacteria bacterium]|nr:MAG: LapA family protein [Gammaproteobacteria bacterium]